MSMCYLKNPEILNFTNFRTIELVLFVYFLLLFHSNNIIRKKIVKIWIQNWLFPRALNIHAERNNLNWNENFGENLGA